MHISYLPKLVQSNSLTASLSLRDELRRRNAIQIVEEYDDDVSQVRLVCITCSCTIILLIHNIGKNY